MLVFNLLPEELRQEIRESSEENALYAQGIDRRDERRSGPTKDAFLARLDVFLAPDHMQETTSLRDLIRQEALFALTHGAYSYRYSTNPPQREDSPGLSFLKWLNNGSSEVGMFDKEALKEKERAMITIKKAYEKVGEERMKRISKDARPGPEELIADELEEKCESLGISFLPWLIWDDVDYEKWEREFIETYGEQL